MLLCRLTFDLSSHLVVDCSHGKTVPVIKHSAITLMRTHSSLCIQVEKVCNTPLMGTCHLLWRLTSLPNNLLWWISFQALGGHATHVYINGSQAPEIRFITCCCWEVTSDVKSDNDGSLWVIARSVCYELFWFQAPWVCVWIRKYFPTSNLAYITT